MLVMNAQFYEWLNMEFTEMKTKISGLNMKEVFLILYLAHQNLHSIERMVLNYSEASTSSNLLIPDLYVHSL